MVIIEKQNMYVLIIEDNKNPELKRIPNRLETLRKIVGNEQIEVIKYKDVLIVYDLEELLLLQVMITKIRTLRI